VCLTHETRLVLAAFKPGIALPSRSALQFHTFRSARTGRLIHRAFAYSLPESIHALVDYVSAVTRFPPLQRPRFRVSSAAGAGVPKTVTPPLINSGMVFGTIKYFLFPSENVSDETSRAERDRGTQEQQNSSIICNRYSCSTQHRIHSQVGS
jgi:hypothetical protein